MEEDGDGKEGSAAPFWVQTPTNLRRSDRLRRLFFSSGLVLFLLLLVTAVFFLVFVVPSTFSFSVNIFRPTSVKRSWDSFNIVLVLAAVVFGFLSRNRNHDFQPPLSLVKESESQKSNSPTQNKWFDYSANDEQKLSQWSEYGDYQPGVEFEEIHYSDGDYQKRFLDDFCVDSGRGMDPWQRRRRSLEQVDYLSPPPRAETVVVDTLLSESTEGVDFPAALSSTPLSELPVASPAGEEEVAEKVLGGSLEVRKEKSSRRFSKDSELPNPISPPAEEFTPPEFQESRRRSSGRAARRKERSSRRRNKDIEPTNPIGTPPPEPSPPPPPPQQHQSSKREDKRGGGKGNSTKDFLNSLYQKKKKKQRQKSVDNVDSDSLLHEAQLPLSFQIVPPSPPPPPPPPSVFHNLFSSKKQKRKRAITVTLEQRSPSPPPAPPRAAAREPEPTSQAVPLRNHKPPTPVKINTSDRLDEASNSGGKSPLNRLPPPPPPMPPPPSFLKNPAWKSAVQGDYIRVNSSRSGSSSDSSVASHGGDVAALHQSPLFCPSPDVNTKAEDFITNFRAKLNLEKIHSTKKRELGPSTLGPSPN